VTIRPLWACVGLLLAGAVGGQDSRTGEVAQAAPLRTGDRLDQALASLNRAGHRIVYSTALVTPSMRLAKTPTATHVEALLEELLAPYQLRAVPASNGDWLVVAAPLPPPATRLMEPSAPSAEEEPVLQTIDVTASRYGLATGEPSAVFLDRRGVEQMPHLADDALRMLKVLPGVSGGDFSAALNIRGGRHDETLLRIDGAEIHGGYHFRDLDGALSVLDTNLVDSIDFITGGMTARHGRTMSGVVDIRTHRPSEDDEYRHAAGVSFVTAYGRSTGLFAEGRGSWLASVRRGYLDVIMARVQEEDEQITPRYTDLFASMFLDVGEDGQWSSHVLFSENDLQLINLEDDEIDSAGDARSVHAWTTLAGLGEQLEYTTTLSLAQVRERRDARGVDEQRGGDVQSDFRFRFLDLTSDWRWSLSTDQLLLFGLDAHRSRADYDYALVGHIVNPTAPSGRVDIDRSHVLEVSGSRHGAHLAWRGRLQSGLVLETGVRWDEHRYPRGESFRTVSPRFNAVMPLGARGELRGAWGVARQAQGIDELQIEDGVTDFSGPERVRQSVLGYLHRFDQGFTGRIDYYHKAYDRLRPRFENLLDPVQLIPEGAVDRVRIDAPEATARGVELTVRREAERGWAGWAGLSLAEAIEREPGGGWVSRSWEQRRTLSMGVAWTGAKWNLNLAGVHHSGTPTTRLFHEVIETPGGEELDVIVSGPRNGGRMAAYTRLDLRASRTVHARSHRFSYYLEVTNLLNRYNPCCIEGYGLRTDGERTWLRVKESAWLPMLPSFGFQFEF
jgi:hypothetical protein